MNCPIGLLFITMLSSNARHYFLEHRSILIVKTMVVMDLWSCLVIICEMISLYGILQDCISLESSLYGRVSATTDPEMHSVEGAYLFPGGSSQDEGGEDWQGVLGVSWPALDVRPHGKAEHRHRLGQGEGLIVLLRVPTQQPCAQTEHNKRAQVLHSMVNLEIADEWRYLHGTMYRLGF